MSLYFVLPYLYVASIYFFLAGFGVDAQCLRCVCHVNLSSSFVWKNTIIVFEYSVDVIGVFIWKIASMCTVLFHHISLQIVGSGPNSHCLNL